MKQKHEFKNIVAETLLIPLYMRAKESRRAHPILNDKAAERLADSLEYDYSQFDGARLSEVGCVVRGWYGDRAVRRFIDTHPRPVVVNVGCGDARDNAKALEAVVNDITAITGQRAVITKARKSVANFKLREGMAIGVKVTLRHDKMWEFLDRLFNVALPRVRDFRGISANSFDGRGNYALGLREQLIFPEIDYDKIEKIRGMDIAICTTANTDEEARELLKLLGAPFIQA